MTEQEYQEKLVVVDQRSLYNSEKIKSLEDRMDAVEDDQRAIYKIATSMELMAQKVNTIESKVDVMVEKTETNAKIWTETERKLSDRVNEIENGADRRIAKTFNSVKNSVITAICTSIATGLVGVLILLLANNGAVK